MAAAVDVVELRLRDRVVDVDRREQQLALLGHHVEAVDAGRRLLGDAAHVRREARVAARVGGELAAQQRQDLAPLLGLRVGVEVGDGAGSGRVQALVQEHRGVAAVVDDQRRAGAVGPLERLRRAPPVLLERLALPGEDRDAARRLGRAARLGAADDDRGSSVILRREDVARDPAHVGAEHVQRLDQHGRLHGHVQAAHDAGAGERLPGPRSARAASSGRASPARPGGSRCGRTRRARDRRPCTAPCPGPWSRSNGWVSDATAIMIPSVGGHQ